MARRGGHQLGLQGAALAQTDLKHALPGAQSKCSPLVRVAWMTMLVLALLERAARGEQQVAADHGQARVLLTAIDGCAESGSTEPWLAARHTRVWL